MKQLWLCLALAVSLPVFAEVVNLKLANGLSARANFTPGKIDKPAVVILHGFLQTFESPTVHHLSEALKEQGYTLLTPNLSLNVTDRRQSLACEAIHNHSMADDLSEIDAWISWLRRKRPVSIVLVGHSFGSIHALAYLNARPNAPIGKYIGISAVEARVGLSDTEILALREELDRLIRKGGKDLVVKPFSYCRKFTATPTSLASYLEWTPQKILDTVNRLPLPSLFIMGDRDDRLGPRWTERLQATRVKVVVVAGANHFMDGEHEFELFDTVISELQSQIKR